MNTDAIQISSRDSNARSILKDIVRKHVPAHYELSNSSGKAEVVQSNIKRVKSLLDHSVFHYKVIGLADDEHCANSICVDREGPPSLLRAPHYPCYHIRHVVLERS